MNFKIFLILFLILLVIGCSKIKESEDNELISSSDSEIPLVNSSMKCLYKDGDLGNGTILVKDLKNFKDIFIYTDGSIDITILRNESNNVCLYAYSKQEGSDGAICNKQCKNENDAGIDESNRVVEILGSDENSYLNCTKSIVNDEDLKLPADMFSGVPCEEIKE